MLYDLSSDFHRRSFMARVENLMDKGAVVEMTEKAFRTPNQNRYLHLLIGIVAMETGNTLEDVKREYFKKIVNPDIFLSWNTDVRGNGIAVYRSTAAVSKEELSVAIDRFKRWGAENGIYMPDATDDSALREIEIQVGRNRTFLGG